MAIYSCNLKSIGRSTHAAGTAGAHISYIARSSAAPEILCQDMPDHPRAARAFLDAGEKTDRKNARVVDKIRVALPRELSAEQRAALVRGYMADLTGGKVAWFAAIHQTGKDAHNPHAHIVVRDRDIETGKRVLYLSDNFRDREKKGLPGPKAVDFVRERWEHHINLSLERAGHTIRVDRRSLEAQGIDRNPQIHIGPRAQHIDRCVDRPQSKVKTNGAGRKIDYPVIDKGRTRQERRQEIIDLNLERSLRAGDVETRSWARFEKEQQKLDRMLDKDLTAEARLRTFREREVRRQYRDRLGEVRDKAKAAKMFSRDWGQQKKSAILVNLESWQAKEKRDLESKQRSLWRRGLRLLDITGKFRAAQAREREKLASHHAAHRKKLEANIRQEIRKRTQKTLDRLKAEREDILQERRQTLREISQEHGKAEQAADRRLQWRESMREQAREELQKTLAEWKRAGKVRDKEQGLDKAQEQDNSRSRAMERFEEMQARSRDQDRGRERTLER